MLLSGRHYFRSYTLSVESYLDKDKMQLAEVYCILYSHELHGWWSRRQIKNILLPMMLIPLLEVDGLLWSPRLIDPHKL